MRKIHDIVTHYINSINRFPVNVGYDRIVVENEVKGFIDELHSISPTVNGTIMEFLFMMSANMRCGKKMNDNYNIYAICEKVFDYIRDEMNRVYKLQMDYTYDNSREIDIDMLFKHEFENNAMVSFELVFFMYHYYVRHVSRIGNVMLNSPGAKTKKYFECLIEKWTMVKDIVNYMLKIVDVLKIERIECDVPVEIDTDRHALFGRIDCVVNGSVVVDVKCAKNVNHKEYLRQLLLYREGVMFTYYHDEYNLKYGVNGDLPNSIKREILVNDPGMAREMCVVNVLTGEIIKYKDVDCCALNMK